MQFIGVGEWSGYVTALFSGTLAGFAIGLIPGIGGRTALILAIPLVVGMDPYSAAIFLFALHSVVHTSSSIPSIALGMPISGADAATVIDGYALTKLGRGGEALGASLSASALGGVLGALAFIISIPFAQVLVASFGPPELLLLSLVGLTMVASLSKEGILKGIVVGILGIILGLVGVDDRTSEARFTMGWLALWDGLSLPALICGLFVIPEMLNLKKFSGDGSYERALKTTIAEVWSGMFVTFRYGYLVFRSTLYGIFVGFLPSVGSTIGVWMAYSFAARTTHTDIPFGKGAIAGVIAPEAANNSKEGGAMIPTLLLGIPGSSSMAIMMAGLSYVGVAAGPNMLGRDLSLSYLLGATVIAANIIVILPFLILIPFIVRMSAVNRDVIAPLTIVVSVTASLIAAPDIITIIQIWAATVLGIALLALDWPRAPFILGFVVAKMLEKSYATTAAIWGWSVLERPQFVIMAVVLFAWLIFVIRKNKHPVVEGPRVATSLLCLGLIFFFLIIFGASLGLSSELKPIPLAASLAGAAICLVILLRNQIHAAARQDLAKFHGVLPSLILVAAIPVIGLFASTGGYLMMSLRSVALTWRTVVIVTAVMLVVQYLLLSTVFNVLVERDIIGHLAWRYLGF